MLDKIGNMFDPGKFLNNLIDQVLPGPLGNIAGDIAGMGVDAMMGNYLGALSNFNDFFSNVSGMFQGGLEGFLGEFGSQVADAGSSPSFQGGQLDPAGHLSVDQQENKIVTPGGYTVEANGNAEWTITSPNGEQTRIWGDPHVEEKNANGVEARWDWDDKTMSFVLPDGTKITANATDATGVTLNADVYYGNEHVQINGMNTANPTTSPVMYDAAVHDRFHEDGSTVFMAGSGNDWFKADQNGLLREITGGGGHNDLTLGNEMWVDAAIKQAAQLTGMPWMGDNPVLPAGGGAGGAGGAQGQGGIDLMDLLNRLGQMIFGQGAGQVQQAGQGQAPGEVQQAQGPANDGILDLNELEQGEKNDISDILAKAKSGVMDLEEALFAIMSKAIENQQKEVLKKAQAMDKKSGGGQQSSQTDMIELQMASNRLQKMQETLSNMMKAFHDAAMTAARNVK